LGARASTIVTPGACSRALTYAASTSTSARGRTCSAPFAGFGATFETSRPSAFQRSNWPSSTDARSPRPSQSSVTNARATTLTLPPTPHSTTRERSPTPSEASVRTIAGAGTASYDISGVPCANAPLQR
jgi:hypothetical protein